MNHHSVFVPEFLTVDPQAVSAEIRENGYYVFEEALTSSFIDALVSDFECSDILENSTRILPHYRFNCKNYMYGLAVSEYYFNLLTHNKIFEICDEILGSQFSLYSHRYYESHSGGEIPWHIDSKDDVTKCRIETNGLQFLAYCIDVLDGETQAVQKSNSENIDDLVSFSKELIDSRFPNRVKGFRLPAGSLLIMDTKTIHRAAPITTRGYVRKAVQFRVNEGYIDGQEQIVNASFFDLKEKPRLTYYFKFGITPTSQNSGVDDNHIPLTVFLKRSAKIISNKTKAYFR